MVKIEFNKNILKPTSPLPAKYIQDVIHRSQQMQNTSKVQFHFEPDQNRNSKQLSKNDRNSKKDTDVRYSVCLPLYEQVNDRHNAKKIFPHYYQKQGRFVNKPLERLELLSTCTANPSIHTKFISSIMKEYIQDKQSFKSVQDFAVIKLNEISTVSNATRVPNRVRTAICCDLFESIVNSSPVYSNDVILERLKIELYRSIFGDNKKLVNKDTIISRKSSNSKALPPKHHISNCKVFFETIPFFEKYDKLTNKYQQLELEQKFLKEEPGVSPLAKLKVVRRVSNLEFALSGKKAIRRSFSSLSLIQIMFTEWKAYVSEKMKRFNGVSLQKEFKTIRTRQNARMQRFHFNDWKQFVHRKKIEKIVMEKNWNQERYQDILRSSMILMKKNNVLEFEIKTMKNIMAQNAKDVFDGKLGGGIDAQNKHSKYTRWNEKVVFQMELKLLTEKIEICHRDLVRLQTNETLVFPPVLLSKQELKEKKQVVSFMEEHIVLKWVNYHLSTFANDICHLPLPSKVVNFSKDFQDCCVILLLLHKARGDEIFDLNKLSQCFVPARRKHICQVTTKELSEFFAEGVVLYRDLIQNRSDIIFSLLVNLMQRKPMLRFDESFIEGICAEMKMHVKRTSSGVLPNSIPLLKDLIVRGETILNKAKAFRNYVETSNEEWLKIMNRLQAKVLNCYAQRRIGSSQLIRATHNQSPYDSKQNEENVSFNTNMMWLSFTKLRHLLHSNSKDINHEEFNAHQRMTDDMTILKQIESVLSEFHHKIFESFQFYAAQDYDSAMFSQDEAKVWAKDCHIFKSNDNKLITDSFIRKSMTYCEMPVDTYLRKMGLDNHGNILVKKDRMSLLRTNSLSKKEMSGEINFVQFMEFLVRIAFKMYSLELYEHLSYSEKVRLLLNDHVMRYSQSGNELRDSILSKSMSQVLFACRKPLYEAYCYYCAHRKHTKIKAQKELDAMIGLHFDAYVAMLEELQLLGSSFTKVTFKSIFRRAQYQDDKAYAANHGQLIGTNKQLADCLQFDSFLESLVVIAIYKKPDPYLPLSTRVEEFLMHSIIDPLYHKNRISQPAIKLKRKLTNKSTNRTKHIKKKKKKKNTKKQTAKKN